MYSLLAGRSQANQPLKLPLSLAVSAVVLALPSVAAAFSFTPTVPPLQDASFESQSANTENTKPKNIRLKNAKPNPTVSAAKANVYAGELSIAGVTLSSTKDDVLWMLGEPKVRETPAGFIDEILYFGGISVSISGGYVWDIVSTSPKFCTPSGVCPGDPVSYVFNTLGPTDIVGQSAVYTAGGCAMDLAIASDTVSQIMLACR